MSYQVGERIGDYEVIGILGAGGMGKVYKVRNVISERVEALKVLLPNLNSDPELADRFIREIKVQASLDHPNIAGLHTAQRAGNQLLMIMEFVEGATLDALLQQGPLPLTEAVDYTRQVLAALAYAHERGVVHRDIKPANMMRTSSRTVKLMDFGIAKMSEDRKLTQTGRTVGSLYYMSPEQINGAALDQRSDLYSLGISLYEMVTGRRPFQGDSDYSIMAAHLNSAPVPPVQIDPKLPPALSEIILMAIAKDPAQRFQSANAFRNALEGASAALAPAPQPQAAGKPAAPPPPPPVPVAVPRSGHSNRGVYIAIGSVLTIGLLIGAAVIVPRWTKSSSASAPSAPVTLPSAQPPNPVVTTPQATPQETVSQPPAAVRETAPASAGRLVQEPVKIQEPVKTAQTQPVRPPAGSSSTSALSTAPAAQPQAPPQQGHTTAAAPAATPPAQERPSAAPAGPDPAQVKELQDLRELYVLIGTRAGSIKSSISVLRQQQAAQGFNIRPDLLTAQQRMDFHMSEADGALRRADPSAAKKSLDSAERELEKLEKFFNR